MSDKIKKEIFMPISENVKALESLFPSAVKDGQVDFDALKQELEPFEYAGSGVGTEHYEFTWNGKAKAKAAANTDILGRTLKLKLGDGVDEDTTQNLYIEGDNFEVLKLLRNSYYNRIKMIYIDPPYNTGSDLVYRDKFMMTEEEIRAMEEESGDIDDEGNRLVKNTKDKAAYHTNWCNMIYPRLRIARDLLTDDGVIFISIDDNELDNLKKICNEVFGEQNFAGCAGRITKKSNNKGDFWAPNFDYVLTYGKNIEFTEPFLGGINFEAYDLIEEEGPRKGEKYQLVRLYMSTIENRNPEQRFWIDCPDGSKLIPPGTTFPPERPNLGDGIWRWTRTKFEAERDKIVIKEVRSSNLLNEQFQPAKWNVYTKTYLNDVSEKSSAKPNSFIEDHINQKSSHELNKLGVPFDYAKPTSLLKFLMEIVKVKSDDIVLDFFSGSATLADAVMQYNVEQSKTAKFICVQVKENIEEKETEIIKFLNSIGKEIKITELGKERIRRAGTKIKQELAEKYNAYKNRQPTLLDGQEPDNEPMNPDDLDIGFKVFKVADTNIRLFSAELEGRELRVEDFLGDKKETVDFNAHCTDIDVVYELLIRHRNIPLSAKIEKLENIGNRTYMIADTIVVCLEQEVTSGMIEALSNIEPLPTKFIFRDSSFGDDISLKDNAMTQLTALIRKSSGDKKKAYKVEFI